MSTFQKKFHLTPAQMEVLELVAEGLTDQQIADRRGTHVRASHFHVYHLMKKLGVSNRTQAALLYVAERSGL